MLDTVKYGVIKMKIVSISHGGQMGCSKTSVCIIGIVENLIFGVLTVLPDLEQMAVQIKQVQKNEKVVRLKTVGEIFDLPVSPFDKPPVINL